MGDRRTRYVYPARDEPDGTGDVQLSGVGVERRHQDAQIFRDDGQEGFQRTGSLSHLRSFHVFEASRPLRNRATIYIKYESNTVVRSRPAERILAAAQTITAPASSPAHAPPPNS